MSNEITNSMGISPPRRFIYTSTDMDHFRTSPAKREFLTYITALGRSTQQTSTYLYDPIHKPLSGLSPAMASLHGSLRCIATKWIVELPPDRMVRARFGNPVFRLWHQRLVEKSRGIIMTMMDSYLEYMVGSNSNTSDGNLDVDGGWDMNLLESCAQRGFQAADCNTKTTDNNASSDIKDASTKEEESNDDDDRKKREEIIIELQSYLSSSFGHEIRLDYGTGHEASFFIFLYALSKLGFYGTKHNNNTPKTSSLPTTITPNILAPIASSIVSQYLQICRGLQTDYMLEPAGSHGVWGLDDYHCIPFYIGACQLQNKLVEEECYTPSSIHDDSLLASTEGDRFLYFSCIRYIKSLKKNVPFFESSPYLNDISQLSSWSKVSSGLLRLFEGEVLDKMPVVQHFVFGNLFIANWKPSEVPKEAPKQTFFVQKGLGGEECIAPWAVEGHHQQQGANHNSSGGSSSSRGSGGVMPPITKAPWAK